eukprot:scaffold155119_cov28-Tisochrysis_lutea.AAC.4
MYEFGICCRDQFLGGLLAASAYRARGRAVCDPLSSLIARECAQVAQHWPPPRGPAAVASWDIGPRASCLGGFP